MEFKQWLEEKTEKADNYINSVVTVVENPQKLIYEAMNYSLRAGGKRLRPVLLMASYEVFGGLEEDVLPFAASMEMIHTYSLIHDDLPAMDNDDYRRGKPSNHKQFGEATAILAGDALLNRAFEKGLEAVSDWKKNKDAAVKAMLVIAQSSGTEGMIGGQVVDMYGPDVIDSLDALKYMYSLKTGAIIKSSIIAGAILGEASEQELDALGRYAECLGIAFQIEDDILDVTGSMDKLGKPIGSDSENNKKTYVSIEGLVKSREAVKHFTDEATRSLDIFGVRADMLRCLAEYLTGRES